MGAGSGGCAGELTAGAALVPAGAEQWRHKVGLEQTQDRAASSSLSHFSAAVSNHNASEPSIAQVQHVECQLSFAARLRIRLLTSEAEISGRGTHGGAHTRAAASSAAAGLAGGAGATQAQASAAASWRAGV